MDLGGTSVPGPRPYNEDTFAYRDLSAYSTHLGGLTAFIMVSDGMGGHQSGDVASRIACETAESYIDDLLRMAAENQLSIEPALALREIVDEANSAVLNAAAEAGGASMGATFVGAFVSDTRAWIGHVGDSRAYRIHRGTGTQLTTDHSQVGRMIAEGVLTEEQAQAHPQRNVIDRALGFSGAEAEVDLVDLEPGDLIVLCSDGLSTVLSAEDIASICGQSANAQAATASLADEAVKAGSDDNVTAVVCADDWRLFQAASPAAGKSRRAMSSQRRAAARHRNAHRSTLYIAGAIGVLALGLVAVAVLSTPKGGSSTAPVARSVQTSTTPPATGQQTVRPASDAPSTTAMRGLKNDANLRLGHSKEAESVAQRTGDASVTVPISSSEATLVGEETWYLLTEEELRKAWDNKIPEGLEVRDPKYKDDGKLSGNWPEKVWVSERALK
jgi:protein phosphatase